MATTLLLWLLYFFVGAAVAGTSAWLKRPIPPRILLVFLLLPILFLIPGFVSGLTPLPLDHAMQAPPWSVVQTPLRVHNIFFSDVITQYVPWAKAMELAWQERTLPLRNRWNGCGTPLAANGQSAAFFPLTILASALPLVESFTLAAALKLLLSLSGTWLWLRELRLSREASLFGAVAFSFSMTMTPWLLSPIPAVNSLWPWALFAIELLRQEDSARRGFWLLTAVLALWPLSGNPESAASGAAFIALWLLTRWLSGDLPEARRSLPRLALAAVLALFLTAFFLLPLLFAIRSSNRLAFWRPLWTPILSWKPHGSVWGNGIFTAFFPHTFGDGVDAPMIEGAGGAFGEMALAYIGIVGWACALLILRPGSPRPRSEWALLAPLVCGFGYAVGLWPFAEIIALIPGLKLILPLRFLSWTALAGAGIAAFELDRLRKDLESGRRRVPLFAAGLATALALFALATHFRFRELHVASGGAPSQDRALAIALITLAVFGSCVVLARRRAFPLALALTAACGLELLHQGTRLYSYGRPKDLFPPAPVVEFLRGRQQPFRVVGEGAIFFPHSNILAGVEEIRTHDPVERRDYIEFLDATAGYPPAEYFKHLRNLEAPSLDFLNVQYRVAWPGAAPPAAKWVTVYAGQDAAVFENRLALPRVFAPRNAVIGTGEGLSGSLPPANAMRLFRHIAAEFARVTDWRDRAYVAVGSQQSDLWPEGPQPAGVQISDYRESANSASFRARNPSARRAVLVASLVQDGGWSARGQSGERLPTAWANGPFLALSLPPGDHRVRLTYSPPGFRLGSAISLTTLFALAAAAAARRVTSSRRGRRGTPIVGLSRASD